MSHSERGEVVRLGIIARFPDSIHPATRWRILFHGRRSGMERREPGFKWMSPGHILRAWMPPIHAGMTDTLP